MNRRRFLALTTAGTGVVAGCSGGSTSPSSTTESERDTIYVNPDGSPGNDGTRESPLQTVQGGILAARPGQTVHVEAGQYFESPRTVRGGTESAPITITGPPEAVISGDTEDEYPDGFTIRHSHVHVRGLTFDGLQDPGRPDEVSSYMLRAVTCIPEEYTYSTGLVVKPHAVGNVRGSMIDLNYVENVEVGEFRVIGPGGLRWILTGNRGHWGEIVYVGQAPGSDLNAIEPEGELSGLDTSNDIHIHHIDNSQGYRHSELVNTKLGTHDVTVEYCTDGGGSVNNDNYPPASISLQSYGATVRWCELRDGTGRGISVGSWNAARRQMEQSPSELSEAERKGGTDNAIYGNRISGFPHGPFAFDNADDGQTPDEQRLFCGNEYDGRTVGDPDAACPDAIPAGDGVGHLGGDSPWE
jgi:hypothetical protein